MQEVPLFGFAFSVFECALLDQAFTFTQPRQRNSWGLNKFYCLAIRDILNADAHRVTPLFSGAASLTFGLRGRSGRRVLFDVSIHSQQVVRISCDFFRDRSLKRKHHVSRPRRTCGIFFSETKSHSFSHAFE
jgi:hypothetical protein